MKQHLLVVAAAGLASVGLLAQAGAGGQGLEDGQAGDPDFLASVKDLASRFSLGEGETKAVDVKLSTPK